PQIRDVIVSGGDPLTLPVPKLKFFLDSLAAIRHVDVIRIGTRVPVTLPQKLYDQGLIDLLAGAGKVWIQTHFNHPREITPAAARGVSALLTGDRSALIPAGTERMARRQAAAPGPVRPGAVPLPVVNGNGDHHLALYASDEGAGS